MKQFAVRIVELPEDVGAQATYLGQLGAASWQLVAVVPIGDVLRAYLVREMTSTALYQQDAH